MRYRLIDQVRGTMRYLAYRTNYIFPDLSSSHLSRPDPAMDLEYFIRRARNERHRLR